MVRIYKGEDTRFANLRKIVFTLTTTLDLTGYTARFFFMGNDKCIETAEVATKTFTIEYTTDETREFPLGENFGTLHLYDAEGRHADVVKVIVSVMLRPCVTVENTINVNVNNVFVDYNECGGKPTINGVTVVGNKSLSDYGIPTGVEIAAEKARAEAAEAALGVSIAAETSRAQGVETSLGNSITNETTRATNAESALSAGKVDKITGKGLSTNDFTNAYKNKLDGIAAGADMRHAEFASLPSNDLDPDETGITEICTLMNTIKNLLRTGVAVLAVAVGITSYGYGTDTAKLKDLVGKDLIVTNVNWSGLATKEYVDDATNETLTAAKEYTDQQSGKVDTNAVESIAESVVQRDVGTMHYTWVRPHDWTVGYVISNVDDRIERWYVTSNYTGRAYSNRQYQVVHRNEGRAFFKNLDPTWKDPSGIDSYFAVDPEIEIDQNSGVFTTSVEGVFTIGARRGDEIRYAEIVSQAYSGDVQVASYYAADVYGSYRQRVNDAAKQILDNAPFVKTNIYVYWESGVRREYPYSVYNTFVPRMTMAYKAGFQAPFAISQHILASAVHYSEAYRLLGTQVFDDGAGNTSTVTKVEWIDLDDWARTNGFSESEISQADIGDLALIRCSKASAVPDGCIPTLMNETAMKRMFGSSVEGLLGWSYVQALQYAIPVVFVDYNAMQYSPRYYAKYSDNPMSYSGISRYDVCKKLYDMGVQYKVYAGDSGRPAWVNIDGVPVIITTWAYSNGLYSYGASYVKGYRIIKAFVESYGDTLKGIEQ